jgi:hypothetical protein
MNPAGWHVRLRIFLLTLLVWFRPSVIALQSSDSRADLLFRARLLPIAPGQVVCQFIASQLGFRSTPLSFGACLTMALVGLTTVLAYRCQSCSCECLPLLVAFVISFVLWSLWNAMLAA